MREILFRGKRTDNGKWVEGELLHDMKDRPYLYWKTPKELPMVFSNHAIVDPTTLGQFTGLTDKNGKKIFEGDIVQFYGTYALEVYIDKGHTKIRWFDTVTKSKCSEMFFGDDEDLGECEVIGNIHDNPELLGGAEDG